MSEKSLLFVGGVSRSGTSALTHLLNCHPAMMIGMERYFRCIKRKALTPAHFDKEAFLTIRDDETHPDVRGQWRGDSGARYDRARIVGDKFPRLAMVYDHLLSAFPAARILYILRNPLSVMQSYDRRRRNPDDFWKRDAATGLSEWNRSVRATAKRLSQGADIVVVAYERLFGARASADRLYAALGLDPAEAETGRLEALYARAAERRETPCPRDDDMRLRVMLGAAIQPYRTLAAKHCILAQQMA